VRSHISINQYLSTEPDTPGFVLQICYNDVH